MLNTSLAVIFLSGIVAGCLLVHRWIFGNPYKGLTALMAMIFFGASFLMYDTALRPWLDANLGLRQLMPIKIKAVFGILFWLSTAYLVNRLIKHFVYARRLTWMGDTKVPLLIQYLVTLLIYLLALMAILGLVFKQSITGVAAASGAVLLVLGYSARSLLDEFFAGLALNIRSPFEKGDLIQLDGEWGYIRDIDWRSITYQDMDNNFVTVPNTKVAASKIRNLDRPTVMTRRTLFIRVEYNVPPAIVVQECDAAMGECQHIAPHPWNYTAYFDCDEKGMRYKLHFHVAHYDDWYVGSDELMNAIWYRFARKKIRFAHQRRLNFMDKEDEQRVLPDSPYDETTWQALIERFREVPVFEGMDANDAEEIARSATLHIIGPPERIIRAGSKRTSLYLIAAGSADVYEVDEQGKETKMDTVGEDETVGLMSLLTGTPQRTTIRANTECAVWEISSESMHALFERKPEVMQAIAANVARWQAEEDLAIKAIMQNREQERHYIQQRTDRLSSRIVRFFQRENQAEDASNEFSNY